MYWVHFLERSQPLWISQKISLSALAEPLAKMLRLVGSGLKFCNKNSNMAAIIHSPLQNLKSLKKGTNTVYKATA